MIRHPHFHAAALALLIFTTLAPAGPGTRPEPLRIVAFGDSTTAPREALVIYAERLAHDLPARGIDVEVANAGIPSNTTEDARKRFQVDVIDRKPALVILQFGINDAAVDVWKDPPATSPRVDRERFKENLAFFLRELAERDIRAILMTPNPTRWAPKTRELYGRPPYGPEDPDGFNVLLRGYAGAAREIAAALNTPLVDVYAAFQDYGSVPGQSADDLLLDGMHPNEAGHALVAGLLLEAIAAGGDDESDAK